MNVSKLNSLTDKIIQGDIIDQDLWHVLCSLMCVSCITRSERAEPGPGSRPQTGKSESSFSAHSCPEAKIQFDEMLNCFEYKI